VGALVIDKLIALLSALQALSATAIILWGVGAATALLAVVLVVLRIGAAVMDLFRLRRAELLQQKIEQTNTVASFTKFEIRDAIKRYITPDCAQADPSNESDLRNVADVREEVMITVDRFLQHGGDRRHILVLADSGMGKTTFCLNFYDRMVRVKGADAPRCAIIPLSRPDAINYIKAVKQQSDTVLLLDAFDEDAAAIRDAPARMAELMRAASDFRAVVITCRSQFFLDDASIPKETGVSIIGPRKAGEGGVYKFYKLYLLPFTTPQIDSYIRKQFAWWRVHGLSSRRDARRLVKDIPELAVRPMLLALIPDLAVSKKKIHELYDLYQFMVDKWLERESRWVNRDSLLAISKRLAVFMYAEKGPGQGDRASNDELRKVVAELSEQVDWRHLTARSLLNRDSDGNFKFAHRSIMEFLFVSAAIDGKGKCFGVVWTDLMRELFVSWGSTPDGLRSFDRAREILRMDLRVTKIAPLAAPLETPRPLAASEISRKLNGTGSNRKGSRTIPAAWRADSLRMLRSDDVWMIYDLGYDLTWRIGRTEQFQTELEKKVFRGPLSEFIRGEAFAEEAVEGFRLPSVNEFISLMDAEAALSEGRIIDRTELYWLGNQLGRSRHLVASICQELAVDELLSQIEGVYSVENSDAILRLYEVSPKVRKPPKGGNLVATAVMVRAGSAEQDWYSDSVKFSEKYKSIVPERPKRPRKRSGPKPSL
jgi:hypothetical protein